MGSRGAAGRGRRGLVLALLAGGLCSLVVPSAASAAVPLGIGLMQEPGPPAATIISYGASPGQQNNVTVELSGTNYVITDTGAGVTTIPDADGPGFGCEPIMPNRYTCPDQNAKATCWDPAFGDDRIIRRVTIDAADGDDVVTLTPSVTADSVVFGQEGDDRLFGSACRDYLDGGIGNDYLDGGAGDDELHPGLGDDYQSSGPAVIGGAGSDTVSYSERSTPVKIELRQEISLAGAVNGPCKLLNQFPATGADFVELDWVDTNPGPGVENLEGGQGNDCLFGSRFANSLKGGPGQDKLAGGEGDDTVDYSDSDSSQPVKVTPGDDPFDTFQGNDGEGNGAEGDNVNGDVENIIGGKGDDTLIGQDEIVVGSSSRQDPRSGLEGVNRIYGGPGNDTLDGKEDADLLDGGEGTDTVTYAGRTESVVGSIGDGANDDGGASDFNLSGKSDSILGNVERVLGGAGADVLRGNGGVNRLEGNGGEDHLNGGGGDDELSGGAGDDLAEGAGGNDILRGDAGADALEGGDGSDLLDGGGDEDVLDGGSGPDTIIGGPGGDGADYSSRLGPVTASADGVAGDGEAGEGDNVAGDVEDLLGGIDDDTLVGNGDGGIIDGGGGDDLLDGGGGPDDLVGGAGADRATYAGRTAPVTVDLTTIGGDGEAGEDDEITDDVEKVSGGAGNDILIGDGAANILGGGDGVDTINGGDGFDLLHGDGGNDNLNGAGGTDQLFGDAGNDALLGGSQNDTLSGGANNDSLDGATGADILNGNDGSDTANYAARTSALNVTLDGAPNDGQSGENDLVKADVENVTTGSGNDNVNSADGLVGRVSCGRGTDTVKADTSDTVAADCEVRDAGTLSRCAVSTSSASMSRSGVVRVRINCPAAGRGTVSLKRGKTLGKKRFTARAGRVIAVKVKLSKKGRRTVNRARRNRLRMSTTISSIRAGKVQAARGTTRSITIRAPRGKR